MDFPKSAKSLEGLEAPLEGGECKFVFTHRGGMLAPAFVVKDASLGTH